MLVDVHYAYDTNTGQFRPPTDRADAYARPVIADDDIGLKSGEAWYYGPRLDATRVFNFSAESTADLATLARRTAAETEANPKLGKMQRA